MIGYYFLFSIKIHNDIFQVRVIVQFEIMICCTVELMNCSTVNKYVNICCMGYVIKRILMSINRCNVTSL